MALSSMVLRAHCDKTYPGAMTASLTVPWGNSRDDRGGYHLVWPRDLVECATALLALGAVSEARDTLRYLIATQKADGGWYQNQWLGGTPYWQGTQLDEAALPVLLAAALDERNALGGIEVGDMVRRALSFIAGHGPASPQDRWEENDGINAFTMACAVSALVAGAAFLPPPAAGFALALADFWNARIEDWLTAGQTDLAREHGLSGYYVRIAPGGIVADRQCLSAAFEIRNVERNSEIAADREIGTDFLQLVRFGLRAADDPLIVDSVALVDKLLKTETPMGPVWHRYNGDGYGEHDDGRPFDGTGRGRGWPLLTGERGHFELAAGRDPTPFLEAMAAMTGPAGMMPEQVWDTDPIPARGLYPGLPTGSAMPLAWTHAEFLKLVASRHLGHAVDRPGAVFARYQGRRPEETVAVWTPNGAISRMRRGVALIIALGERAMLHYSLDGWKTVADVAGRDCGLGLHVVEVSAEDLAGASAVDFTWRSLADGALPAGTITSAERARSCRLARRQRKSRAKDPAFPLSRSPDCLRGVSSPAPRECRRRQGSSRSAGRRLFPTK
ncbi:MAG: glycoside hydrolase family 15 protein [Hyphomicrobiales bacterium]